MKVWINDVEIKRIRKNFTITTRKDEELDSGVLILFSNREEEYEPFSIVKIDINDDNTPEFIFLIDSDESSLTTKQAPYIYQHTIGLIEATKALERIIVDNLAFTQPRDESITRYNLRDVLYRLRDSIPTELDAQWSGTRLFDFETSLMNEFALIKSPQFFFTNQNLFQVLSEIFKFVNAIPRVTGFQGTKLIIGKDSFNQITQRISTDKLTNKGRANNAEYYVNSVEMNLENAISDQVETYPAKPHYLPHTTKEYVMTTNDMTFFTPKPIYAIKSFKVLLKYVLTRPSGTNPVNPTFLYREVDLTDRVFEEQLYNLLPIDQTGVSSKYGSFVYKQGGNEIKGFGVAFPQFFGLFKTSAAEKLLHPDDGVYADYVYTLSGGWGGTFDLVLDGNNSFGTRVLKGEFGFRVEYYPYIDQRVNIIREQPKTNLLFNYALTTNQSGKALDINRVLTNGQGTVERLGNGDIVLEKSVKTLSDAFSVGQATNDNYIVSSVEYAFDDNFIKCRALLTKNFNRLSQFIGVDREFRQYEIPLNETVNRNLIYNEYLKLSFANEISNLTYSSYLIELFRGIFGNQFTSYYDTIEGVIVKTKINTDSYELGQFYLSVIKSAYKNANIFNFNFFNNSIAYFYPDNPSTGSLFDKLTSVLTPVRYTYFNNANLNDLLNATFRYMDVKFVTNQLYKSASELAIAVADVTAAKTHYSSQSGFGTTGFQYKHGLFYRLTSGTYQGRSYVLVVYDPYTTVDNMAVGGIQEQDIVNDLLYELDKKYTTPNSGVASTSHWKYLGNTEPNLAIRRQLEIRDQYLKANYPKIDLPSVVVNKDPSETISMTYQLNYVAVENIVIGPSLATKSPFYINRSNLTTNERLLHLYQSTEFYRDGDLKAKGTKTVASFSNFGTASVTNGFYVAAALTLSGVNSWAIGDADGNLYFAVNRNLTTNVLEPIVFFNLRNKL